MFRSMEAFLRRSQGSVQDLDRYHILSLTILKTISHCSNIFSNLSKSLFSIIAILPAIHLYGNNAIIPESFKYLVFYNRDTLIELSLLWQSFSIWSLSVSYH